MNWTQVGEDAAKGAAAGSVVPGVGTALGAVGGVALDLAPELGRWLFGSDAAPTVAAVQGAVAAVTGADQPAAQIAALADPDVASQLRVQLANIAASRAAAAEQAAQEKLTAQLNDVANARIMALQLAQTKSVASWGAPAVSVVVLFTFGAVVGLTLLRSLPQSAEPVLNVLLGTLGAMATNVVGYWVGSSAGSARKDERLASLTDRALPGASS